LILPVSGPVARAEGFVGFVNLAQAAIRQSEIIEYALVVGRQFGSALQTIDRSPIVTGSGKKKNPRLFRVSASSSIFTARSNESLARSASPSCQTQLRRRL